MGGGSLEPAAKDKFAGPMGSHAVASQPNLAIPAAANVPQDRVVRHSRQPLKALLLGSIVVSHRLPHYQSANRKALETSTTESGGSAASCSSISPSSSGWRRGLKP